MVCSGTVVTRHIAAAIFPCVLMLLAVHYSYNLEYNPQVRQVLEFLQEKLLADHLPNSRKTTKCYDQLYRAIDCIESKQEVESNNSDDEDCTQLKCEYDSASDD